MTERLYYTDSYLSYVKARVVDVNHESNLVYLDRTAFYPTSGGQPHDLGTISGHPVLDVIDEGDRIAHRTAGPIDLDIVECHIEWERRYDHMQQHSGQHVLSAVWAQLYSIPTVSFHLGLETSTIELQTKEISDEQSGRVERHANRVVREGRSFSISFDNASNESAPNLEGLRKPSSRSGPLRIVTIDGLDRSACGGTHVASTSELAPIQIRRIEKIRGNIRLEFVCGDRAERRARKDFQIASEAGRTTGVSIDDLPSAVSKLRTRLSESEKDRTRLAHEVGCLEGSMLYASVAPSTDGIRRVNLELPSIDDVARAKAQAFISHPRSVVIVTGASHAGVLIACSVDSGLNAGVVLRNALEETGGRGGGTATLAQGSMSDPRLPALLLEKLGFNS